MFAILFVLLPISHFSLFLAPQTTLSNANRYLPFTAKNSTLFLGTLCIQITNSTFIFGSFSSLILEHVQLSHSYHASSSFIDLLGNISFSDVLLEHIHSAPVFSSLVSFQPPALLNDYSSTFSLTDSLIKDLTIPCTYATFTTSGYSNTQQINSCTFENITALELPAIQSDWGVTEQNIIRDTQILASEDTFYGHLVTGPTAKTLTSFVCSNSTFTHCTRIHNPPSRHSLSLTRFLASATCSAYTPSICTSSSRLTYSHTITFTDAEFTSCSSTSYGGALYVDYFLSPSDLLTLTRCSFTSCTTNYSNSTEYGGGAVMLDYGMASLSPPSHSSLH